MLQHDPHNTNLPPNAAQVRVSPEELTAAVAALEKRKQEEAGRIASTISLGQAVEDLHLDATPDEILAEVQAQRARAAQASRPVVRPPQFVPAPVALPRVRVRKRWPRVFVILGIVWAASSVFSGHHWSHTFNTPSSVISHIASDLLPLSEVANGQTVYCDASTLAYIQHGKAPTLATVHTDFFNNSWPLVKYDGKYYFRGYTLVMSANALKSAPFKVYNDDNAGVLEGVEDQKITLPLDGFHWAGDDQTGDWSMVTAQNLHPDEHLFEAW